MATAAFVSGVLAAGEVRAQATLGFTIDPTQGLPGTVVNGQVDVADVDANCVTDITEFQARFQALIDGPFAGGSNTGELFSRFFPGGEFVFETCEQTAYSLTGLTALGIALDIGGATETALPLTFVMTFADLATQQPVGELGHFDPTTGVGSVVTPDVTPGPWAVAAACVGPTFDLDQLEAGIRANGAFLESLGFPTCNPEDPRFEEFIQQLLGPDADIFTFLMTFGPNLIQSIVIPDALGVQIFTVLAPPPQAIENVIGDVQDLVAAGDLKKGQGKALTSILQNALASVERGNTDAACGQLGAFENAAAAMNGAATGAVVAQVETIRGQLGCTPAGSPSGAFVDGDAMP
jgi:hypothetical protein